MKKVNIRVEAKPRYVTIGDYWDEDTASKITYLLHEYQDLFPTNFLDMKGISGYLGIMKIHLKPDVNLVQ